MQLLRNYLKAKLKGKEILTYKPLYLLRPN